MDPADVASEGLAQLPHGPVHIAGESNRMVSELLRGPDRRQSVALMTAGAAALYGLDIPALPVAGKE